MEVFFLSSDFHWLHRHLFYTLVPHIQGVGQTFSVFFFLLIWVSRNCLVYSVNIFGISITLRVIWYSPRSGRLNFYTKTFLFLEKKKWEKIFEHFLYFTRDAVLISHLLSKFYLTQFIDFWVMPRTGEHRHYTNRILPNWRNPKMLITTQVTVQRKYFTISVTRILNS